jgi:hypothetical protein
MSNPLAIRSATSRTDIAENAQRTYQSLSHLALDCQRSILV